MLEGRLPVSCLFIFLDVQFQAKDRVTWCQPDIDTMSQNRVSNFDTALSSVKSSMHFFEKHLWKRSEIKWHFMRSPVIYNFFILKLVVFGLQGMWANDAAWLWRLCLMIAVAKYLCSFHTDSLHQDKSWLTGQSQAHLPFEHSTVHQPFLLWRLRDVIRVVVSLIINKNVQLSKPFIFIERSKKYNSVKL